MNEICECRCHREAKWAIMPADDMYDEHLSCDEHLVEVIHRFGSVDKFYIFAVPDKPVA
tara:strand:- start:277 stop:453 length:177 start_codon:yes stop_codon:yes gene_type:complete